MAAANLAHQQALAEQEELKVRIEEERAAKQRAEALHKEVSAAAFTLKHKALAFAVREAREQRKTQEAKQECERLDGEVTKGAAAISELQGKQQEAETKIGDLENKERELHGKLEAEVAVKANLLKE